MNDFAKWRKRWSFRIIGALLFLLAFATTIFTASTASRDSPPSGELSVLLVLLAGLFQLGSVVAFSRSGRPDDIHAAASVRRLVRLTSRTQELSVSAVQSIEMNPSAMRASLIDLSARLNFMAQDALASVEDWTAFNEAADRKVAEINDDIGRQATGGLPGEEGRRDSN